MRKLISAVGAVLFIGACVYFVAGITAVSPPIKTYVYRKSITALKDGLKKIAISNKDLSYHAGDITGDANIGYRYYINVYIKQANRDLQYTIFYDKTDYWFKKNTTQISLVMAYDRTNDLGGYSLKANGIDSLIKIFEQEIITNL